MLALSRTFLFLLTAVLLTSVANAGPAQASRQTLNRVSQLILKSYHLLAEEQDTAAARSACEMALKIEEKSTDPFIAATVAVCFGDVEDYEKNTAAACKHYAEALKYFKDVPARHSARRTIKTHINVTEGKRLTLACGSGGA